MNVCGSVLELELELAASLAILCPNSSWFSRVVSSERVVAVGCFFIFVFSVCTNARVVRRQQAWSKSKRTGAGDLDATAFVRTEARSAEMGWPRAGSTWKGLDCQHSEIKRNGDVPEDRRLDDRLSIRAIDRHPESERGPKH